MTRGSLAICAALLTLSSVQAGGWLFPRGPGPHMRFGPYTGGHGYSYNEAYSYGYPFSAADTWRRNVFSQPQGYTPYRPNEKPIQHRVFPKPDVPYISVLGPDGMPMLVRPPVGGVMDGAVAPPLLVPPASLPPAGTPLLQPVPAEAALAPTAANAATVRIQVPEGAEVWVEKQKLDQVGPERIFTTPALSSEQTEIVSVRAKWHEAGREVEQFRAVGVRAGQTASVRFTSRSE